MAGTTNIIVVLSPNQPPPRAYNTGFSSCRARARPKRGWSDSLADTAGAHKMPLFQAARLDRNPSVPATPTWINGRKRRWLVGWLVV
ncbi:hypothetical protein ElyMa_006637400 [Elysia marginata]|uniref:Uncharacterized protein n=1 Tax=Elysia marginata TaxID=1093978 RepID=A0AAV4IKD4_9GAST|nr:hypothetical protein ElyMa_006637400 [Elysia marginata]